jgi:hypothetical protein
MSVVVDTNIRDEDVQTLISLKSTMTIPNQKRENYCIWLGKTRTEVTKSEFNFVRQLLRIPAYYGNKFLLCTRKDEIRRYAREIGFDPFIIQNRLRLIFEAIPKLQTVYKFSTYFSGRDFDYYMYRGEPIVLTCDLSHLCNRGTFNYWCFKLNIPREEVLDDEALYYNMYYKEGKTGQLFFLKIEQVLEVFKRMSIIPSFHLRDQIELLENIIRIQKVLSIQFNL